MKDSPDILYAVEDAIATITFNRPESLNALRGDMTAAYLGMLRQAEADPEVRVVLVTGAGRGFCAGADVGQLGDLDIESIRQDIVENPRDVALFMTKPLIAAINGAVAGIGLAHALMADIRFTVPEAKWTTAFASLGLVAEMGSSWFLTQILGSARALDLLLSARVFTGREAHEYGLAQFISEPQELMQDAREYCRRLASNNPNSLREIRQQVLLDSGRDFRTSWEDTYERVFEALERGDFRDAARDRSKA